jgi:hypothetical protein
MELQTSEFANVDLLDHQACCNPITETGGSGYRDSGWNVRVAQEYLALAGPAELDPHVMPQLDAYIDGPRRPLTKLERDLINQFPCHKLEPRANGQYGLEAGTELQGRTTAGPAVWIP